MPPPPPIPLGFSIPDGEPVAWLFNLLGLMPGDTFDDLYPGTGIVTRCWRNHCRRSCPGTTAVAAGS